MILACKFLNFSAGKNFFFFLCEENSTKIDVQDSYMIVCDTVDFKVPNIYVRIISFVYKSLLIFLLTEDKLCTENVTIYLGIYEIPCSPLSNEVFAYKDN